MLAQLYLYLMCGGEPGIDVRHIEAILLEVAGPEGREDIVNAAEQLIEQGRAEGLAKGRAEGLRTAITSLLAMRQVPTTDGGRARLAACSDPATLTRWHARALTAASEVDVFSDEEVR